MSEPYKKWVNACDFFKFQVELQTPHAGVDISFWKDTMLDPNTEEYWDRVHIHSLSFKDVEELHMLLGEYVTEYRKRHARARQQDALNERDTFLDGRKSWK